MANPDDTPIPDESHYLRALTQDGWWEQMEDRVRVTSAPFYCWRDAPGEVSCYSDTVAGREVFERRFPKTPAAKFSARAARGNGFTISMDPDGDDEKSPEHYVLRYQKGNHKKQYHRDCKQLGLDSIFIPSEGLTQSASSASVEA